MSDAKKNKECEVCGNHYDKAFEVHIAGEIHVFDSFECAISGLAPECAHCDNKIIGHGVEVESTMYCCAHCAKSDGRVGIVDRAEEPRTAAL